MWDHPSAAFSSNVSQNIQRHHLCQPYSTEINFLCWAWKYSQLSFFLLLRSIVMRTSVGVCVCVSVGLPARLSPEPHAWSLPICCACCLWPWLGPPASLRYVMYFRFCGWHHVVFYNGPYSAVNFATKDRFFLNLLIYRKVGHNWIPYY